MEPEVNELIMDSLNINYIDESEYPSTTDIQNRCHFYVNHKADLLLKLSLQAWLELQMGQ